MKMNMDETAFDTAVTEYVRENPTLTPGATAFLRACQPQMMCGEE